jgi:branched-chain amino acid transport system substrate-binding protein
MNLRLGLALGVLALAVSPALAQQPLKIGLIMPYSGQFADAATQMDNAIKLYAGTQAASRPMSPSAMRRSW